MYRTLAPGDLWTAFVRIVELQSSLPIVSSVSSEKVAPLMSHALFLSPGVGRNKADPSEAVSLAVTEHQFLAQKK